MQRFSNLLAGVTCGTSQTTIVFQSQRVFDHAVQAWSSWVQAEPDHRIVLFANWAGCMLTEDTLKPFHFHDMSFDPARLEITLHGVETDWKTATHTMRLAIGLPTGKTFDDLMEEPHISKRSFWHKIGKFFHNVVHKVANKVIRNRQTAPLKLQLGHQRTTTHRHTSTDPRGLHSTVICYDCGAHGTVEFSLMVTTVAWVPILPSIVVVARQVGFKLHLGFDATAAIPESYGWGDTLFKFGVPQLSFSIPHILDMGVFLTLGWGYGISGLTGNLQVEKTVDLGFIDGMGLRLAAPGVVVPLGKWGITHTSTPTSITGFGSGTLSAGVSLALSLKIDLFKIGFISPMSVSLGAGPALTVGVAGPRVGPCSAVARASGHTFFAQPKISIVLSVGASAGANPWGFGIPIGKRSLENNFGNPIDNGSTTFNIHPTHDTSFEKSDQSGNEHVPDPNPGNPINNGSTTFNIHPTHDTSFEKSDQSGNEHAPGPNPFGRGFNDSKVPSFGISTPLYKWGMNIGSPLCFHMSRKRHDVARAHPRDLVVAKTTRSFSLEDFESLGVDHAPEE
ncbi:BZ3500_MvSof-1268-A1-R1_Chr4-1g06673 [Microbotryum saponariae]|uniref:BZ3500_MvSof-1268-A1-R1_Chr4-1g06673 protein n=1 Tax=Microbotryum saponariae TaxID=289078 RepID=A0A2X0LMB7_9BASI|nr:BZ3500_MvSof-1268-A1-R1_Chr4-1g06673 [Microbotryum saponariae]SDA06338.1 BZ3501_MvSof-1269-A2-R1_Chr4-1g06383 [Microbotryum saponariae]